MRLSIIAIFTFLFIAIEGRCQITIDTVRGKYKSSENPFGSKYELGFTPYIGASYQYHINGDIGLMYGKNMILESSYNRFYPFSKVGSEFYFANKKFYMGPKLTAELTWRFLCCRINIIDYTNFKASDLRFTPEAGISLVGDYGFLPWGYGLITICYGYNVPIGSERIYDVPGNRVTITFCLLPTYKY